MNNKILIIAPHPDDETLGCGGAILRHKKEGDKVEVKLTEIDAKSGKLRLSRKVLLPKPE